MKTFIKKTLAFLLVFFLCLEITSRILVDPVYFYILNTFNEKSNLSIKTVRNNDTKHVDYLFVGNSRIPATINPKLLKKLSDGKVVINGGRGNMTAGIHYQALKNKLVKHPDFLKDALVFIDYPGSKKYETSFEEDEMKVNEPKLKDKSMTHLLLPHLSSFNDLLTFFRVSDNSIKVKIDMFFLYTFSSYRTSSFINEKIDNLNKPMFKVEKNNNDLVNEGGIRIDNIQAAVERAYKFIEIEKKEIEQNPVLTKKQLDNSSLAKLQDVITKNGGTLFMYKMPLHSVQQKQSEKSLANKKIFEVWLNDKSITIVHNDKFEFEDKDFPDIWHLAKSRRDDFTTLFYEKIVEIENTVNK